MEKSSLVPLRDWRERQTEEGRVLGVEVGSTAVVSNERGEDTKVATGLDDLDIGDELANHEEHESYGQETKQGDEAGVGSERTDAENKACYWEITRES